LIKFYFKTHRTDGSNLTTDPPEEKFILMEQEGVN